MSTSDGKLHKADKDYTSTIDAALPSIESADLTTALAKLHSLEKQTRQANDIKSTTRLLNIIVKLTQAKGEWTLLNEQITLLTKKHGQFKTSITSMIDTVVEYIDLTPDMATKLALIETIRVVTEGKIFVETQRARVTLVLADIKEKEGDVKGAKDILTDISVETFTSMDRREKTEYILHQIRLLLAVKDFTQALIFSRKISNRVLKEEGNEDLKIRFNEYAIQIALNDNEYLNTSKNYRSIFDTPSIQEDQSKWGPILRNVVYYLLLATHDNEQSDLLFKIEKEPKLKLDAQLFDFVKCFTTAELMRWPNVEIIYGNLLKESDVFNNKTEDGLKRWNKLRERVIEHNIRVIAKYYTRITSSRLAQLLDLNSKDMEEYLSNLVTSQTVYAKIDRPAGVISFAKEKGTNAILNEWASNVHQLLALVEETTHLITKDEMMYSMK